MRKIRGRILLVEDDPDHQELTLYALEEHDVADDVVVANDGADALDYLFKADPVSERASRRMPQVVLLDLKLPKVDGLKVLQRIREDDRTRFLPVVILTSSDEERDLMESYRLGANSYVRKPVDFADLSEAVRHLGIYWLGLNESVPARPHS